MIQKGAQYSTIKTNNKLKQQHLSGSQYVTMASIILRNKLSLPFILLPLNSHNMTVPYPYESSNEFYLTYYLSSHRFH